MKDKNQLTPNQLQQRKKMLVYPIFFLVFAIIMYVIFSPSRTEPVIRDNVKGFNAEIPGAVDQEIIMSKTSAFEAEMLRSKSEEKIKTLGDLSLLPEKDEDIQEVEINPKKKTSYSSPVTSFHAMQKEINTLYTPESRNDEEKEELQKQIEELQKQIEAITQKQPDQYDAMLEKSYKLAAKYFNTGEEQKANIPIARQKTESRQNDVSAYVPNEQVVTRLGELSDSAFIKSFASGKRNLGFNTMGADEYVQRNTIRACINTNQLLLFGDNAGTQEVQIRLLENIRVGDMIIPRNTLITGIAKLSAERLEISIKTLQYLGNLIQVSLSVYDLDGLKGLNCPGSLERNSAKDLSGNLGSNIGTSISVGGNAGDQVLADVSRNVIQGVSQYLGKKIRMTKVTLKSGYEVLIINSK